MSTNEDTSDHVMSNSEISKELSSQAYEIASDFGELFKAAESKGLGNKLNIGETLVEIDVPDPELDILVKKGSELVSKLSALGINPKLSDLVSKDKFFRSERIKGENIYNLYAGAWTKLHQSGDFIKIQADFLQNGFVMNEAQHYFIRIEDETQHIADRLGKEVQDRSSKSSFEIKYIHGFPVMIEYAEDLSIPKIHEIPANYRLLLDFNFQLGNEDDIEGALDLASKTLANHGNHYLRLVEVERAAYNTLKSKERSNMDATIEELRVCLKQDNIENKMEGLLTFLASGDRDIIEILGFEDNSDYSRKWIEIVIKSEFIGSKDFAEQLIKYKKNPDPSKYYQWIKVIEGLACAPMNLRSQGWDWESAYAQVYELNKDQLKDIRQNNSFKLHSFIESWNGDLITLDDLRYIHRILTTNLLPIFVAGAIRTTGDEVNVMGVSRTSSVELPEKLETFMNDCNELLNNASTTPRGKYARQIARLMNRLDNLHPFKDGNGRTVVGLAALLMNRHPQIDKITAEQLAERDFHKRVSNVLRYPSAILTLFSQMEKEVRDKKIRNLIPQKLPLRSQLISVAMKSAEYLNTLVG